MARQIHLPNPIDILGFGPKNNPTAKAEKNTFDSAKNTVSSISSISDFLTNSSVWVRIGEVMAGLILLFMGLKTMFPQQVSVTTSAVKSAAMLGAAA